MKGTNTIVLNIQTMKEALALYLDHAFNAEHGTFEVDSYSIANYGEAVSVEFKRKPQDQIPFPTTESRACL